jgi:hypothetical protein
VGTITLPAWGQGVTDNGLVVGGTVSHDGTRVYVLALQSQEELDANPAHPQRVYVFDSSQPKPVGPGQSDLPVLGYFEISGSSAYHFWAGSSVFAGVASSLDEKTLYIAGGDKFIEVAMPAALNPVALQSVASFQKAAHAIPAIPWR